MDIDDSLYAEVERTPRLRCSLCDTDRFAPKQIVIRKLIGHVKAALREHLGLAAGASLQKGSGGLSPASGEVVRRGGRPRGKNRKKTSFEKTKKHSIRRRRKKQDVCAA